MPSWITTLVITFIRSRRATSATDLRAASESMQGTKKLVPGLNFLQLTRYETVSTFIGGQVCVHLKELGVGCVELEHSDGG